MASKWITGDVPPVDDFVCRRLLIPNDFALIVAVNGALLALLEVWRWEQIDGTATPEQTVDALETMFYNFLEDDCG